MKINRLCKNFRRAMMWHYDYANRFDVDSYWYDYYITMADKYAFLVQKKKHLSFNNIVLYQKRGRLSPFFIM